MLFIYLYKDSHLICKLYALIYAFVSVDVPELYHLWNRIFFVTYPPNIMLSMTFPKRLARFQDMIGDILLQPLTSHQKKTK